MLDTRIRLRDGSYNPNFGRHKKRLLVSFSGGRTSAYMTKLLLDKYSEDKEITVVFANTGVEREETLDFVHACDINFGFNTIWIEAKVNKGYRKGTTYKVVTYETASRNGEPYEAVIAKYGIPSIAAGGHCSRELKVVPIHKVMGKCKDYETAIGIRIDEPKRLNPKPNVIYPLAYEFPTTKQMVHKWWTQQSFDLRLKDYEGNCTLCFKKSKRKLLTIIYEHPEFVAWWNRMEIEYGDVKNSRSSEKEYPTVFYRDNTSVQELFEDSLEDFEHATDAFSLSQLMHSDPSMDFTDGCSESCEAV